MSIIRESESRFPSETDIFDSKKIFFAPHGLAFWTRKVHSTLIMTWLWLEPFVNPFWSTYLDIHWNNIAISFTLNFDWSLLWWTNTYQVQHIVTLIMINIAISFVLNLDCNIFWSTYTYHVQHIATLMTWLWLEPFVIIIAISFMPYFVWSLLWSTSTYQVQHIVTLFMTWLWLEPFVINTAISFAFNFDCNLSDHLTHT